MAAMALEADHVSFAYRAGRTVLSEVSLALEPGTVTAIVGPNGAGKSTLLRLLLGILRPTEGEIRLDGEPIAALSPRARARRIAYVPQRPSVAFAFTVREYVALGGFAGGVSREAVASALAQADIADRADDPFPILSVGQQQRAALARALVQLELARGASTVLLADEPVSAMDPSHALRTMQTLRSLAEGGVAVAVVLHDLSLARRFCDRAAVLDGAGRLAGAGPAGETLTPAVLDGVFSVRFTLLTDQAGRSVLLAALPGAAH